MEVLWGIQICNVILLFVGSKALSTVKVIYPVIFEIQKFMLESHDFLVVKYSLDLNKLKNFLVFENRSSGLDFIAVFAF